MFSLHAALGYRIALKDLRLKAEQVPIPAQPAPDVRALFDDAESRDFESGLDWFHNLVATCSAAGDDPSLLVLRDAGEAIVALPVKRTRDAWGSTLSGLANFYTSRFLPPVAARVSAAELSRVFRAVRAGPGRPRSYSFAPMDRDTLEFTLLRSALEQAGLATFEYFCFGNWYLPVTMTAEQYFQSRPGEVRSTIRRMTRRFDSEGGRIEIIQDSADVERATDAYTQVYGVSWKQPEPYPDFMPGLIRLCAARGWLRLGVAWLGEQPIASQLWIVVNGRASIFKLAYRPEHARLSPGTLLTTRLMKHAIDEDLVREVDYLTGDDAYKQSWMTHRRERWGIVAYDPMTLGGAAGLVREHAGRAVKSLLRKGRPQTGSSGAQTSQ